MTEPTAPVPEPTASPPANDLETVRELVLRAHPNVVPELIQGGTIADLMASVEPASAAYARIAGAVTPAPATPAAPSVPAGGNPPVVVDLDRLPAAELIRRGLAASRR